jgi:hypothetical protein
VIRLFAVLVALGVALASTSPAVAVEGEQCRTSAECSSTPHDGGREWCVRNGSTTNVGTCRFLRIIP